MGFFKAGRRGTITKQRFNCRGACKRLYEGMKGFGTNEDAITEVVAGHTVAQRQEIKTKYKIIYGKDLIKELDSELSGSFGKLVLSLMKDPEEYILESIRNAIVKSSGGKLFKKLQKIKAKKRLCSDAYTLLGILVNRSNQELEEIKIAYKTKYEKDLEEDVGRDFPDEFRSLIFGIIYAGRNESTTVDMELLQEDVESLQIGNDGNTKDEHFQSCFEERSWLHLRELFETFKIETGAEIEETIEKSEVFSDTLKEAYCAVVKLVRNAPDFFAERLKDALDGLGTDDDTLISVIVLRSEIDLVDIIERYEVIFGVSLEDDVVGDTSGDYRNILLKLLTLPEDYDSDVEPHHTKHHVIKAPAIEISTQTEEEEEPIPTVPRGRRMSVNVADDDGHEAVGHEVQIVEEEVEEEEIEAVEVAEVEQTPPQDDTKEEDTVGKVEEEPNVEAQDEVAAEENAVEEEANTEEDVVNDEESPPAEVPAPEEESTAVEETEVEPTGSTTQEDEDEEKKKPEEADNAEGG